MNCPINEEIADGDLVGRCWFHLEDGKTCERHGDVSVAVSMFESNGKLVKESDFYAMPNPLKPPSGRLRYASDSNKPSDFCSKCGSSLKRVWLFIRTKKCIQPNCSNYWDR